jgi:hypothetical protein
VARRTARVEELLALGRSPAQVEEVCLREFRMPGRTTREYVRRVRERWAADAARSRPERRQEARARLLALREEARRSKSLAAAVAAERLLLDLDGLRSEELRVAEEPPPPQPELNWDQCVREIAEAAAAIGREIRHHGRRLAPETLDRLRSAADEIVKTVGPAPKPEVVPEALLAEWGIARESCRAEEADGHGESAEVEGGCPDLRAAGDTRAAEAVVDSAVHHGRMIEGQRRDS